MKYYKSLAIVISSICLSSSATVEIPVMKDAVFYDGYKTDVIIDTGLNDGIYRIANSLYSVMLDADTYKNVGTDLTLHVTLSPRCDNYDRMGCVRLAFVPKELSTYAENDVLRIELARFITPFMNMNKEPDSVPFEWNISEVAYILHDPEINERFNLWIETYLFGVPYSAREQIAGCADHDDVYAATVWMSANDDTDGKVAAAASHNKVYPLYNTMSEIYGDINFNRYTEGATDKFGKTERTFTFTAETDMSDAALYLILTNHGADYKGEEYVRRLHNVFVDDELLLSYTPGGVSCEPYRQYNSQANNIYGKTPQTDWEEWNNWCPGQSVPIRKVSIGQLKAGEHSVKITVPDAQFFHNKGDFRPSLYVQGLTEGKLNLSSVNQIFDKELDDIVFEHIGDNIIFQSSVPIHEAALYDLSGALLEGYYNPSGTISLAGRGQGTYILLVVAGDGRYSTYKVVK